MHVRGHLSTNKVRLEKTSTQEAMGGMKKLLSDHGEYRQKDTKTPLRPLNRLHTAVGIGERGIREEGGVEGEKDRWGGK